MKKLVLAAAAAIAAMAFAGPAAAQAPAPPVGSVEVVPSETPAALTVFDGHYNTVDEDGNEVQGSQQGYIGLYFADYTGGPAVVACNGNEAVPGPDGPAQGYIWIGPSKAASNELAGTGDGTAGAGNGDSDNDGEYAAGETPCPEYNG